MLWSHSRLETYENCPRKFKYQYIDKIEPKTDSIYAFMGSRVHEALEALYKLVHFGKTPPLELLLEKYGKSWKAEKKLPLSIPNGMSEEEFYGLGSRCITNYYKHYSPFNHDTTLGIEEKVMVEIRDSGGPIQVVGYVDRISQDPDGTVRIHDYKTGKMKSQAGLDEDRQLALYQIGLQQRWPDLQKFELVWHYVAYDLEFRSRRTPEKLESLKQNISGLVREIETDHAFEPKKSALCAYCEYQSICPLWKSRFDLENLPAEERTSLPVAQLVDRYGNLKKQRKIIDAELEEIERQLEEHLSDEPKQVLFGNSWKASVSRTEGIQIPAKGKPERDQLEEILKASGVWDKLISLDTAALKKLVTGKKLDADALAKVEPLLKRETSLRFTVGKLEEDESEEKGDSL